MSEVNNHCAMSDCDEEEKTYGGGKTLFYNMYHALGCIPVPNMDTDDNDHGVSEETMSNTMSQLSIYTSIPPSEPTNNMIPNMDTEDSAYGVSETRNNIGMKRADEEKHMDIVTEEAAGDKYMYNTINSKSAIDEMQAEVDADVAKMLQNPDFVRGGETGHVMRDVHQHQFNDPATSWLLNASINGYGHSNYHY